MKEARKLAVELLKLLGATTLFGAVIAVAVAAMCAGLFLAAGFVGGPLWLALLVLT